MRPQHRYYRDPDERAAAQATGCILGLLLIAAVYLYHVLRPRPAPYRPVAPDNPTQKSSVIKREQIGYIAFACIGIFFLLTALGEPSLGFSTRILGVGSSLVAFVGTAWFYSLHRQRQQPLQFPSQDDFVQSSSRKALIYTIFPARDKVETGEEIALMQSLLASAPRLSFEIVTETSGIVWRVVDRDGSYKPQVLLDHLRSHLPRATIVPNKGTDNANTKPFGYPYYRQFLLFQLANDYAAPIPSLDMFSSYDPLAAITQRMDFLHSTDTERLTYGLVIFIATNEARRRAEKRLNEGLIHPLVDLAWERETKAAGLDPQLLKGKLDATLYHCFLVVQVESRAQHRLAELSELAHDVALFGLPGHNRVTFSIASPIYTVAHQTDADKITFDQLLSLWVATGQDHWRDFLLVLSPAEVAALWHMPDDRFSAKHIAWSGQTVPEELTGRGADRVNLGISASPGYSVPISMTLRDRAYHHYVTGKTGMGKSTLLHNLVRQDIAAGRGVVVVDPHGKLADDILARSVPVQRLKDVILLECGQTDIPVPLNPFRVPKGVSFITAFNYLYWAMSSIYASVWRVGRMDLVVRYLLHALLCDPGATPFDIERVFSNTEYRQRLVELVQQHPDGSMTVANYWRDFTHKSKSEQVEIATPIRNRTSIFLGNRALELMTCHPHMLNFQAFVRERKIVLVNLSGEAIRSEVASLGALFLAGLFMASEALGYLPDGSPPRCYFYLDEAERILTNPVPDMYAQARKCGLSLTLSHQYLDQLSQDTLNGILGNVGTKFVFECGEKDARGLALYFEPEIDRHALQNLGAYHMAVKTRFAGKTLPALIVKTNDTPDRVSTMDVSEIRKTVRENVKFPSAAQVRVWQERRYTHSPKAEPAQPPRNKRRSEDNDGLSDYE